MRLLDLRPLSVSLLYILDGLMFRDPFIIYTGGGHNIGLVINFPSPAMGGGGCFFEASNLMGSVMFFLFPLSRTPFIVNCHSSFF